MNAARLRIAGLLFVLTVALVALAKTGRVWTMDGYTYAVMARVDTGVPFLRARDEARAIYEQTPVAQRPLGRHNLSLAKPPWWHLFAPRVVYPALCAALWLPFGKYALFAVPGLSFIALVLLTYALALRFADPAPAALAASCTALTPVVRTLGASTLTDATAIALWLATLLLMMKFVRKPGMTTLVAVLVTAAALTLTRPLVYAPFCCGAALFFVRRKEGLLLAAVAIAAAAAPVAIALRAHAHVPLPLDYVQSAARALFALASAAAVAFWPLAGFAGVFTIRDAAERAILLGAAGASLVSVLANPIPGDALRVAFAPLVPLAACGIAALLSRAVEQWRFAASTA